MIPLRCDLCRHKRYMADPGRRMAKYRIPEIIQRYPNCRKAKEDNDFGIGFPSRWSNRTHASVFFIIRIRYSLSFCIRSGSFSAWTSNILSRSVSVFRVYNPRTVSTAAGGHCVMPYARIYSAIISSSVGGFNLTRARRLGFDIGSSKRTRGRRCRTKPLMFSPNRRCHPQFQGFHTENQTVKPSKTTQARSRNWREPKEDKACGQLGRSRNDWLRAVRNGT